MFRIKTAAMVSIVDMISFIFQHLYSWVLSSKVLGSEVLGSEVLGSEVQGFHTNVLGLRHKANDAVGFHDELNPQIPKFPNPFSFFL